MTDNRNSGTFFSGGTGMQGSSSATFFAQTTDDAHIAIINTDGTPELQTGITAGEIRSLIEAGQSTIVDNGDNTYTVTDLTTGSSFTIDLNINPGSTVEVNNTEVTNPDFTDNTANRGIVWSESGGTITAVAGADSGKADIGYTILSSIPPLGNQLEANREYVFQIINNTGSNSGQLTTAAFEIHGETAQSIRINDVDTADVSVPANSTRTFFLSWSTASVDIIHTGVGINPITDIRATFGSTRYRIGIGFGQLDNDFGGHAFFHSVNYRAGDIVSFTTGGVTRFFTRIADGISDQLLTPPNDPTNWREFSSGLTYDLESVESTSGAILRLNPSEGSNDDVLLAEGDGIDITRESNGNITIASTNIPHPHGPTLSISSSRTRFTVDSTGDDSFIITVTETDSNSSISAVTLSASIDNVSFSGSPVGLGTRSVTQTGVVPQIAKQGVAAGSNFNITALISGTTNGTTYTNERRSVTFTFEAEQVPYYIGTMSVGEFSTRDSLTFAQLTALSGMTEVDRNISLPLTHSFSAVGEHVALLSTATVSQITSQGFTFSFQSRTGLSDGSGNNYNLYVTDAGLSAGTHSVTFS